MNAAEDAEVTVWNQYRGIMGKVAGRQIGLRHPDQCPDGQHDRHHEARRDRDRNDRPPQLARCIVLGPELSCERPTG